MYCNHPSGSYCRNKPLCMEFMSCISVHVITLSFCSFCVCRDFKLRLSPGSPHLSPNLIVETTEGAKYHKPDYLYVGELEGEPETKCHGSILKGIFTGFIRAGDATYYIEPAHRHFDEPTDFHSIIYKGSDVEHPDLGGCGLTRETMKWMKKIQESAVDTDKSHRQKVGKAVTVWVSKLCR
jgi:hypothetical protein